MFKKTLRKRLDGIISADMALSPLMIMTVAVCITIFLMAIYYGISYLFFSEIMIQGARSASITPDVGTVQTRIFNGVTRVLPETKAGVQLYSLSDISINANDGDYVTVSSTYQVMLPGLELYKKLGGNPANWTAPAHVVFSFYREY